MGFYMRHYLENLIANNGYRRFCVEFTWPDTHAERARKLFKKHYKEWLQDTTIDDTSLAAYFMEELNMFMLIGVYDAKQDKASYGLEKLCKEAFFNEKYDPGPHPERIPIDANFYYPVEVADLAVVYWNDIG